MERELTYLACPYTHRDRLKRIERFMRVTVAAGWLMAKGEKVYSPITHTHTIAEYYQLPAVWDFWREQDFAYLRMAKKMVVLKLDGWERSTGVTAEIVEATRLGIPVEFLDPSTVPVLL